MSSKKYFGYFEKRQGKFKRFYRKIFYKWIIKKYLKKCKNVLDVGSGEGLFYDAAKELGKDVEGIDMDDRNLRENIIKKDYRSINKHYDCCFNSQFIEHVNIFKFMKVMANYCDKIIITITVKPCMRFWNNPYHIRPYTKTAIELLYKDYGFQPIFSINLFPTKSIIVIGKNIKNKTE